MAENRKYYFLKLKEDFFEQDTIVLLESLKDGILYSNILMKMYLKRAFIVDNGDDRHADKA